MRVEGLLYLKTLWVPHLLPFITMHQDAMSMLIEGCRSSKNMVTGEKLDRCISLCKAGVSLEEPSLMLRTVLEELGEITGDSVSDTLVDTIFSRFCVGK